MSGGMSAAELMAHIEALPDPERDRRPPPVLASKEERKRAEEEREERAGYLVVKKATESEVKYILEGRLFGGHFRKDGDWKTVMGAEGEEPRQVWTKKVTDYYGSIALRGGRQAAFAYVEVKGMSPGKTFSFSRLDHSNNPRQQSQHTKMTAELERRRIVWLALGFWDAIPGRHPVEVKKHGKVEKKWRKDDTELTVYLVRWSEWLEIYQNHKYRSLRQKDRELLDHCRIYKEKGVWRLCDNHWWHGFK